MVTSLRSVSCLRSGLVALLMAGGACADDTPSVPTSDSETETDTSTSGPPITTTPDPDSTTTMDPDDTRGESTTTEGEGTTTEGVATDSTTTDGGGDCGNGMVEGDEECDGEDLDGQDCASQDFTGGELSCADDCTFDTSACTEGPCGNGAIDEGEACDGAELGEATCESLGFDGGALACAADCAIFDTSGCSFACEDEDIGSAVGPAVAMGNTDAEDDDIDPSCGGTGGPDRVMRWTAPADGFYHFDTIDSGYDTKLALYTDCATELLCNDDLEPGVLQSRASAELVAGQAILVVVDGYNGDTGDWVLNISEGAICGDGLATAPEVCDGEDAAGETCVTQGFDGGFLGCTEDCASLDLTGCADFGGDCCASHAGVGCDDAVCQASVCGTDAYCCETNWDVACANIALNDPACQGVGGSCLPIGVCGDGVINLGEACDGADLSGDTCESLGYTGGVLACLADCSSLDTSGCTSPACAHPLCELGVALDPLCDPCATTICAVDPFCCEEEWDLTCFNRVGLDCGMPCPTACGNGVLQAGEPCDGDLLDGETCLSQGFAGGGELACLGDCTDFDTTACVAGVDLTCSEEDIGGALGASVTSGTTVGGDSDLDFSCGGTDGPDRVITFTAPANGVYVFDTVGSGFDTKLALFSSCDAAAQLACNDDIGGGNTRSRVIQAMDAGDTVLVGVSGYNGATGNWVLNITQTVCGDGVISTPPEVCDGADVGGQTCAALGYTGGVVACGASCTALDFTGCTVPFTCEDQDLGSAIGAAVASGTTVGSDNDLDPSCGAGNALDHVMRWTAPAAGQYTFNTIGSGYDTVMSLFSNCTTQLTCNDDGGGMGTSLIVRNLAAGETVLILVDGYSGATGNWTLNITSP